MLQIELTTLEISPPSGSLSPKTVPYHHPYFHTHRRFLRVDSYPRIVEQPLSADEDVIRSHRARTPLTRSPEVTKNLRHVQKVTRDTSYIFHVFSVASNIHGNQAPDVLRQYCQVRRLCSLPSIQLTLEY